MNNFKPGQPLYSFIIPVYNTGQLLYETLDSILSQTFNLNQFQVIIIDDCSTDQVTIEIVDKLISNSEYKGLKLEIIRNEKNSWLAETRNIGARKAKGKYLVCLDSDDTLEPDFIKHTFLAFAAYPNASWVYPSVRKFGYKNKIDIMDNFSAKKLFLNNYVVAASPVKRELWEKLNGQKTLRISESVKLFEDWDFWQRALGKGKFGVPIKKVIFNYRQNIKSLITRSEDEGSLSTILAYRKNWTSIFGLKFSKSNYETDNNKCRSGFGFVTKVVRKIIKKVSKRNPSNLKIGDILLYIFLPSVFIKRKTRNANKYTKVHKMAGFKNGFKLDFDSEMKIVLEMNNTILCTHFWWHLGGAENIFLDYMKTLSESGHKIIDVVNTSVNESSTLRNKFSKSAHEQFALDEIAEGPYPRMLALWELIKLERPKIILNMSNPFIYILSPLIREKFPEIVIYDLLHCEEYDENGWFESAYNYQNYINKRIVTSEFWKEVLIEKYNEKPEKISVIYNTINYNSFVTDNFNRESMLKNLNINANKRIIGFLGRFHEQKRPDLFVDLAEKMQSNNEYHFVMAGDGEMLEDLADRIKSLQNLTYLGPTNSPEKVMPMFNVAVFPSRFEGYALVSMECACLSIPVIVPNINGFKEQIENGQFGIMYNIKSDPDDVDSIMNILINQYDNLIRLGSNGPTFINTYHNETEIKRSLNQLFTI